MVLVLLAPSDGPPVGEVPVKHDRHLHRGVAVNADLVIVVGVPVSAAAATSRGGGTMPRYERRAVETAGHRLRLYYPGRRYVGGDGRDHVVHQARCIRCPARARVYDGQRGRVGRQSQRGRL